MAKHHQEAFYCCHMKLYVHKLYTREIGNMYYFEVYTKQQKAGMPPGVLQCCKFIGEFNLKCHIKERKLFSLSQTSNRSNTCRVRAPIFHIINA